MDKEKLRKEMKKRGIALLELISDELFLCEICCDVDRLGRLVTLFQYHTNHELMKDFRDRGLDKELLELAKKAGKMGEN